ncbi:MAG: hypothetical protein ABIH50_05150 [bacterium]
MGNKDYKFQIKPAFWLLAVSLLVISVVTGFASGVASGIIERSYGSHLAVATIIFASPAKARLMITVIEASAVLVPIVLLWLAGLIVLFFIIALIVVVVFLIGAVKSAEESIKQAKLAIENLNKLERLTCRGNKG